MHGLVRFVFDALPPFQIAFFRNVFGLLFLLPLLMRSRFAVLRTQRIGLHALRGVINIGAMLMFFTALSISPLAKVTALSFTAPIFMAILSVFILGERFRIYRWLAILLGFSGMLIILRPGIVAIDTAKVSASINQRHAKRKWLGHPNHRIVDRTVIVRVIVTHYITDHLGTLTVLGG